MESLVERGAGRPDRPLIWAWLWLALGLGLGACAERMEQPQAAAADANRSATAADSDASAKAAAEQSTGGTDATDEAAAEPAPAAPAEPAAAAQTAASPAPAAPAASPAEPAGQPAPSAQPAASGPGDVGPPGSGLATGRPYVVIRFPEPGAEYEKELKVAVQRAQVARAALAFDLVAVTPAANSADELSEMTNQAQAEAAAVRKSLADLGIGADRVSLITWTGQPTAVNEIRLYIR